MSEENGISEDNNIRDFILLCLRGRLDPDSLVTAQDFSSQNSIDWDACLECIRKENLSPLIYSITRGKDIFPGYVEEQLNSSHKVNRVRNIFIFDELKNVLRIFKDAQIPVTLLKGAALAREVYQDFSIRPLIDVDLLIPPQKKSASVQKLKDIGFKEILPERQPGAAFDFENEIVLLKPGPTPVQIELHWSLFDSPFYQNRLSMEWFWNTADQIDFYGIPALMFSPPAQVLHLCSHMVLHHKGDELLWLHDVAEVVNHYQKRLDWDTLLARAREFDLIIPVKGVMSKVVNDWNVPVPEEFLLLLNTTAPSPDELRINPTLSGQKRSVGQRFLDDTQSLPGFREKIRFILSNLFPSPSYMRHRYNIKPSVLIPLYYPYRWIVGIKSLF